MTKQCSSGIEELELTILFLMQVMSADKKASQAAEQAVAATVQPAQESSTPSIPFAAVKSMNTAPAERKSSRAENIFDLAVSLCLLQLALPEECTMSGLLVLIEPEARCVPGVLLSPCTVLRACML